MVKRFFDVLLAATLLGLLLPFLIVIALAVLVTDGPPVLFRQLRVGRCGRDFVLFKFRTMAVQPGAEVGSFDPGATSVVSRLGAWLRHYKVDELPQLWNVLRGDMSLVGPRPEVRRWTEVYPARWSRVLMVRPGITDPASIEFRNEQELLAASCDPELTYRDDILPRKLDINERYIHERSLLHDAAIIWQTVRAVIRG